MKKILNKNLILSVVIGLFAMVLFLHKIYPQLLNADTYNANVTPAKDETSSVSTVSDVEIDEIFFSSMDEKELIHYKILNSIDFFSSVEGQFNTFNIFFSDATVTYAIDIKNKKSHVTTNEEGKDLDYTYNNGKAVELNNLEKNYREIKCNYNENALSNINAQRNNITEKDDITANIQIKDLNRLKPRQRYDFTGVLLGRSYELFSGTGISILSQGIMVCSMNDYSKWDIEGEETFLDRVCTKISGNLNVIDKRSKSEKFIAWVDTETGVVVKYYEEDGNGKQTSGFETIYIKYNNALDENLFTLDFDKYPEKVFPGR
ncbi:MAG: hypothetical protein RSA29_14535 [Clostridium sp.]|uniref:hypothetical protein n=1 Tax=Clostridium sp. TaxID=1506 RepID=UPI003217DABF